ncbi:carbohydrate ABC transporter permease [Dictyobacter formicarum]|uniref:Sugar-binding protein n=1 Tax=Dictyobacter formicarum TaxID=2778368 RepID=A0ABQ3VPK3_9CHLR|nr:sugar ABC transporter permease [Dictyobacter formicarum]GHO87311.1 sugar-binding protein [Dictyobacter formicarum]
MSASQMHGLSSDSARDMLKSEHIFAQSHHMQKKRFPPERRRKILAWSFMLPFLLVNGVVVLGPSISTFYYAFTDWSGMGEAKFVGLANFIQLFGDADFHQAFLFNLIWLAMFLTVPIAMGLLGAFLLSQIKRFQMFFRAAYFIPYIIASVVNASIWEQILDPQQGLASLLNRIGLHFLDNVYFFGDAHYALLSVAFVDNWHFWGYLVVLFLAAMQAVSPELYEAARVDGASRWKQFLHVTIPGIRPVLGIVLLLVTVWSLLVFEYPFIITQGGPAGATQVMSILMYKNAFALNEAGYAAAMGLSLSFIAAIITGVYLYLQRKGVEI